MGRPRRESGEAEGVRHPAQPDGSAPATAPPLGSAGCFARTPRPSGVIGASCRLAAAASARKVAPIPGTYDGAMRPRTLLRIALGCAALACFPGHASADGADGDPKGPSALESPGFPTRRDAEKALYLDGVSVLAGLAAGDADVDTRIAALDAKLADCERAQTPAAARAAARVATRLEASATDEQVRRIPRLLRVRLDRMLPLVVVDRTLDLGRAENARIGDHSLRGLFPEARPILLDRVRTTADARALAGALAALCSESGSGIVDDADLEIIGAAWEASPTRFDQLSRFESVVGAPPLGALALALTLTGRARDVPRVMRDVDTSSWSLKAWIEPRLKARGQGDLTMGSFLVDLEEGRASATSETAAAARALDASIPWLARLLARRALFLEPSSPDAAKILTQASNAVGLRSPARRAGRADGTPPTGDAAAIDDEASVAIDEALRAGFMSQRLSERLEAGTDEATGLLAAAIGGGRLVHATMRGGIRVVDTAKEKSLYAFGRSPRRGIASLAVRGDEVAAIGDAGDVTLWSIGATSAELLRTEAGSAQAVAAGAHGFWVAGFGFSIRRITKDGVETFEKVAPIDQFVVRALGVFPDDTLFVASNDAAWHVDPATGRMTRLAWNARNSGVTVCGDDILIAVGDNFVRFDRHGRMTGRGQVPDGGEIRGVAAERDGSTVYVQTIDALYAMDPANGHERWVEHIEGSGNPVVGDGLVVARAGTGGMNRGGDGREDRTFFVLRTATSLRGPFGVPERERLVALATAIASDGHQDVVRALVDPVLSWLSSTEAEAIEAAMNAGRVEK